VRRVHNGHSLMGRITGSGCTATTVIGAFCAVNTDAVEATASALAFFGLAGEYAARAGTCRDIRRRPDRYAAGRDAGSGHREARIEGEGERQA